MLELMTKAQILCFFAADSYDIVSPVELVLFLVHFCAVVWEFVLFLVLFLVLSSAFSGTKTSAHVWEFVPFLVLFWCQNFCSCLGILVLEMTFAAEPHGAARCCAVALAIFFQASGLSRASSCRHLAVRRVLSGKWHDLTLTNDINRFRLT